MSLLRRCGRRVAALAALVAVVAVLASACGGESADDILAKARNTDLSPAERCSAISDMAFWSFEEDDAVAPLRELAEDPNDKVARCAVETLGNLDNPDAVDAAADALVSLLEDDDPRLATAVLKALGPIGDASAVEPIERLALRHGTTPAEDKAGRELRRAAVVALGRIGSPHARSTLVRVLSTDAPNREAAGTALARIFQRDVTPLLPLLDERRNISLAFALVDVGQKGTEDALVTTLNRYGDLRLAEYYLNCGNGTLEKAARAWADRHGYTVMTSPGSGGGQWGSGV